MYPEHPVLSTTFVVPAVYNLENIYCIFILVNFIIKCLILTMCSVIYGVIFIIHSICMFVINFVGTAG